MRPVTDQLALLDVALSDPKVAHVYIDISWDETAKYITSSPEAVAATAALINKYPDRFLFGTDVVAPASLAAPMAVYDAYAAALAGAHAGGEPEGPPRQLPAAVRQGARGRAGVGKGERRQAATRCRRRPRRPASG